MSKKKGTETLYGKGFSVSANYNKEAKRDKILKFKTKRFDEEFEITLGDVVNLCVTFFNQEDAAPLRFKHSVVKMTNVERQLVLTPERDIKAGEELRLSYSHPMPLEWAIAEEAAKRLSVDAPHKYFEISDKDYDKLKKEISESHNAYLEIQQKLQDNKPEHEQE